MSVKKRLQRWQEAGLLDQTTANKILAYETGERSSSRFAYALYGLGSLAIFLGIAAIISVNWAYIPDLVKLGAHTLINLAVAGVIFWRVQEGKKGIVSEILAAALAALTLTFIGLIGQIYQSQEPGWKVLALWLFLVTPFLLVLAQSERIIGLWVMVFLVTYGWFMADIGEHLPRLAATLAFTLFPFLLIVVGQNTYFRKVRENWAIKISYTGFCIAAIFASIPQYGWSSNLGVPNIHMPILWQAFFVTLVASIGIIAARRSGWVVPMVKVVDIFLPVTVFFGFLPFLLPHGQWPVVGAAVVMIYWAFCGWVALNAGYPKGLELASTLIALRLIIVYVEVFGSLLQTGVGLIVSGILLIGLVVVTRKFVRYLRPKALKGTK